VSDRGAEIEPVEAKKSHSITTDNFLEFNPTLFRTHDEWLGPTFVRALDATFELTSSLTLQFLKPKTLKMWILPLLGYVGVILGFAFLTLAIGMSTLPT
jgi:hypothetical protein